MSRKQKVLSVNSADEIPNIDLMNRATASFQRTLNNEISWSRRHDTPFSLVVLSTVQGITTEERAKLLGWGELVLRNTAPERARVLADERNYRCLMLIPGLGEPDASLVAAYLEEQMNKLPVFGVAPGGGWHADFVTYPNHAAALRDLAVHLAEGVA